jgi:O-antigen ligase
MIIDLGVIGILYFAAFAWGANEPWAMGIIAIASLVLLASQLLWDTWHKELKLYRSALYVPLLLFLACASAQLLRVRGAVELGNSWLPHTVERHSTLLYGLLAASYVAIVFLVHHGFRSRNRIKLLFLSILALGVFESLYGLVQYLGDYNYIWDFDRARVGIAGVASGTLINRNHYALLLNLTISAGVGYLHYRSIQLLGGRSLTLRHVLSSPHSAQLAWILLWLALMGLALFFSMSRMGVIAMLACVAMMIVAAKLSQSGKRAAVLGFSLLFVIIGLALYTGIDAVLARYESLAVQGYLDKDRLPIWRDAWKMIEGAPLFGRGLGTFRWTFPAFETFEPDAPARYTHNDYLQALTEVGVVGLVLLLWAFGLCWRAAARNLLQSRDPLVIGIGLGTLGALSACALQEVTDFSLYIPGVATLFAALIGLNLRASRELHEQAKTHPGDAEAQRRI